MSKKTKKEDAENWLQLNCPHIQVLEWGGSSGSKSLFLDKDRNREFYLSFSYVRGVIKSNPDYKFGKTKEEIIEARTQTNIKKYGGPAPLCSGKIKEKIKNTNLEKYGVANVFQCEKIKEKIKNTNLEKYGVEHPSQDEEVRKRVEQTNLKKYGAKCSLENVKVKKKRSETWLKKYGVTHPAKSEEIKEKIRKTNLEKYGTKTPAENNKVRKKIRDHHEKMGITKIIKGKTMKAHAKQLGVAYTTFQQAVKAHGVDYALSLDPYQSSLEVLIANFLKSINVSFACGKKLKGSNYRPDFIIEDKKLIIECDGLYWHSDLFIKDKNYHKKKREEYESLGYASLFFREDEINDSLSIVQSIILNKLKMNKRRYYARSLEFKEFDNLDDFFKKNHLMGKGRGRCFILADGDNIVSAMQVHWADKENRILSISRFCNSLNTSVVGGWSRLVKNMVKIVEPKTVINFVDARYGSGCYLEEFGFSRTEPYVSFRWTDYKKTYHRMKFPGNSGYQVGLAKIWDCGQVKYKKGC